MDAIGPASARDAATVTRADGTATPIAASGRDWPTAAQDAANTSHSPSALAPTADPTVEWSFGVTEDHVAGGEKDGGPGKITGSAATVVDGAVYVGDTGHGVHENFLYAIDADTGELLWRHELGVDGIRSTPAVADGRVYVGNGDNRLTAIEATTGTEAFVIDVGRDTVNSYQIRDPTIVGETVYFGVDRNDRLHAADLADGAIEWTFDAERTIRGASGVSGESVYVTASRNGEGLVFALAAETGRNSGVERSRP